MKVYTDTGDTTYPLFTLILDACELMVDFTNEERATGNRWG
jgi:hypothetical protein